MSNPNPNRTWESTPVLTHRTIPEMSSTHRGDRWQISGRPWFNNLTEDKKTLILEIAHDYSGDPPSFKRIVYVEQNPGVPMEMVSRDEYNRRYQLAEEHDDVLDSDRLFIDHHDTYERFWKDLEGRWYALQYIVRADIAL